RRKDSLGAFTSVNARPLEPIELDCIQLIGREQATHFDARKYLPERIIQLSSIKLMHMEFVPGLHPRIKSNAGIRSRKNCHTLRGKDPLNLIQIGLYIRNVLYD